MTPKSLIGNRVYFELHFSFAETNPTKIIIDVIDAKMMYINYKHKSEIVFCGVMRYSNNKMDAPIIDNEEHKDTMYYWIDAKNISAYDKSTPIKDILRMESL